MRVLYIMYPTGADITSCSTFAWSRYFIQELVRRGHYVYWCCPKKVAAKVFEREPDFVQGPKITWVDVDTMPKLSMRTHYYLTTIEDEICEKFTQLQGGKYYYDAIVNDRVIASAYLRAKLYLPHPKTPAGVLVPLYNAFHYVFSDKNKPNGHGYWNYEPAMSAGMVGAYNIFAGPQEEEMIKYTVRKWLSPSATRQIFDKSRKVPFMSWFTLSSLDPYRLSVTERRRNKTFAFNYAQAETELYKFPKLLSRIAKMFAAGRTMRLVITSTTHAKIKDKIPQHTINWPGVDHYVGLPRDKFYAKLRSAHAFFCEKRGGEMNPANMEQIYLGLIPVLPNVPWAREMVPEGYRYLYDNTNELEAMIREVQRTYYTNPDYPELVHQCQEHVKKFDATSLTSQIVDHVERTVRETYETKSFPSLVKFMVEELHNEGVTELKTYEDWRMFVKTHAEKQTGPGLDLDNLSVTRYFASRFVYYAYMKRMGWVDTCEYDMPTWKYSGASDCTI